MNKLYELLDNVPSATKEQFEKTFKRVFGIPAEIEEDHDSIIFKIYDEQFSLDFEGTLLWYRHNTWHRVTDLNEARRLWRA